MIISHNHTLWRQKQRTFGKDQYNGALYYSKEICDKIIPNIRTDRNWITVNVKGIGCNHAIVFVHSNLRPDHYDWLQKYDDLILVCGVPETCEKVAYLGRTIYLPLSIDVEYVRQFAVPEEQRKGVAFVGRESKTKYPGVKLPKGIYHLTNLRRDILLQRMARYKSVYAIGRVAVEAKALGLEVLPYDPRYPDPDVWEVFDTKDAIKTLQRELDRMDKVKQIFNHEHPTYKAARAKIGKSKWNGAYYYSKEICERIIPNVDTDRAWITLNIKDPKAACDHAIVFVHNHRNCPECYEWLTRYDDLVFVCSELEDIPKLEKLGRDHGKTWHGIFVPLSVDVDYVKQFRRAKTKGVAFCGRAQRQEGQKFPKGTDFICNVPREQLLEKMAQYKKVYATDRCAIEALILGCEILPFDPKHPDPSVWEIRDNKDAVVILQGHLDNIDKKIETCVPSMKLTKAELVAAAEARGVQINSRMTKAQIIDAIEAAI